MGCGAAHQRGDPGVPPRPPPPRLRPGRGFPRSGWHPVLGGGGSRVSSPTGRIFRLPDLIRLRCTKTGGGSPASPGGQLPLPGLPPNAPAVKLNELLQLEAPPGPLPLPSHVDPSPSPPGPNVPGVSSPAANLPLSPPLQGCRFANPVSSDVPPPRRSRPAHKDTLGTVGGAEPTGSGGSPLPGPRGPGP